MDKSEKAMLKTALILLEQGCFKDEAVKILELLLAFQVDCDG